MVSDKRRYYSEFIRQTNRTILEQDQSADAAEIVREIESHRSGLEEKEERAMGFPHLYNDDGRPEVEDWNQEPYPTQTLDKIPMEDKIIMSREEDYPESKELTPGEISKIVNKALRDLPEELLGGHGSEISDACFDVAYAVMHQYTGY